MKPNFTDNHRFPVPYVPSGKTDVAKTFARIRRQIAEDEKRAAEAMKNVKPIKERKKA